MTIRNLPPQATPFIGRTRELREIANLLADPNCRLLTLVGPGGIGKTRLALEAAAEQTPHYPNGVFFVPLQPLSSSDLIPSSTAEALQLQFRQGGSPQEQLLDFLRHKRLLLLFDNFEHLLPGADLVYEILAAASAVKILVTSRAALNFREEWLYPLQGMSYPILAQAEEPGHYDAVQLFLQSARRARPDFSLAAEQEYVVHICQLVAGMPLALEMTAAWLKRLPCRDIASEIERGLDILESPASNVPPRHRSMRAVFDHSWNLLTEGERKVFMKLSVFRGGFRKEAAEAVAGASLHTLSSLVDKSLVRLEANRRYDLHELLRQYAEERLNPSPEESAQIRDLHCAYYADLMPQTDEDILLGTRPEWLAKIEGDMGNMRAAFRRAVERDKLREMGRLFERLWRICNVRGWYDEGERTFRWAVEHLRNRSSEIIAEQEKEYHRLLGGFLSAHARFLQLRSRFEEADILLAESLTILRALPPGRFLFYTLHTLSLRAWDKGDVEYQEAIRLAQEALAVATEIGFPWGIAQSTNVLCISALRQGELAEAKRLAQEGQAIAAELGDRYIGSYAERHLGQIALEEGDYVQANIWLRQSVEAAETLGFQEGIIDGLNRLGSVYWRLRQYDEAQGCFCRALRTAFDIGSFDLTLDTIVWTAGMFAAEGAKARAVELCVFALHHSHYMSTVIFDQQPQARALLADLESDLPPAVFTEAQARGSAYDTETLVKSLLTELSYSPADMPSIEALVDPLSERERTVLRLLAAGYSNPQIANELVVAHSTVKKHINHIYSKLGVSSRIQAVIRARDLNLL
jgi:predicted ATPase/DNA-binding NarL/FixJ family response regulator